MQIESLVKRRLPVTGYIGAEGSRIFYRYWQGEGKAVIVSLHGLCGDSRIFTYLASMVTRKGYDLFAIDLLGFGLSDGERGDVSFDSTIQTLNDIIKGLRAAYKDKVFLLGFSLGGLYALWYASIYPEDLKGIISIAPALRLKDVKRDPVFEPPASIANTVFKCYINNQNEKFDLSLLMPTSFGELGSSEWAQMMNDPICNTLYSSKYIVEVLLGKTENIEPLIEIKVPILILHGERDRLVLAEQSKRFIEMLKLEDKRLALFDCDHWFFHTFFYSQKQYDEESRAKVIDCILEWLEQKNRRS